MQWPTEKNVENKNDVNKALSSKLNIEQYESHWQIIDGKFLNMFQRVNFTISIKKGQI